MTGIQKIGQVAAKMASGPGQVAGLAAAGAVGFGAAHAISNRGDYQHNRSWQVSSAIALLGVGAGAALLGARGSAMARSAMGGSVPLAKEVQLAALNAASATGARKAGAAQRLDEAVLALERHTASTMPTGRVGLGMIQGAGMLAVGASAGVAVTSTRLDPGTLHVVADWNIKHETESFGEQRADEVRGAIDHVQEGGSWIRDHIFNNPFN